MKNLLAFALLGSILFSSCFVTRTTVGYGPIGTELRTRTFSKVKQRYVVFGLIPLNKVTPQLPPQGTGYEVKTSFSFIDAVVTLVTAGIYGQRTIKILVDKIVEKEIQQNQKNQLNSVPSQKPATPSK